MALICALISSLCTLGSSANCHFLTPYELYVVGLLSYFSLKRPFITSE